MLRTKLFDFQKEDVRRINEFNGRCLLANEVGLGKAQPIDAKVLTPTGWTPIGDIRVGDYVIGSTGKPVAVTGVFSQGALDVFEVEFKDGAVTRCCENHLWQTTNTVRRWRGQPDRVFSLKEIRSKFRKPNGGCLHYIPIVSPVTFPRRDVPLDPYLLGYLLANGSFKYGTVGLSSMDTEVIDNLSTVLPSGVVLKKKMGGNYDYGIGGHQNHTNPVTKALRDLNLMGKGSPEKYIPELYQFNSVAVRLPLLQGLLDGDGYASKDGVVQYVSVSQKLARGVRELVWSLGGTCSQSSKIPTFRDSEGNKKEGLRAYTLTAALPHGTSAFRLSRKKDRASPRDKYPLCRAMTEIRPAGAAECVCISVDAPDNLYVTDDYILTHNTLISLYYAWRYLPDDPPGPVVVVVPAHLKVNWSREAEKHLGIHVEILSGQRCPSDKQLPINRSQIYVVNYDVLCPPRWKAGTAPPDNSWLAFLSKQKPRLVICDEAQYAKTVGTMRTRAVKLLCKNVRHVLMLTGTPLANKPGDLWTLLNILHPKMWPSRFDFLCNFTHMSKRWWGWNSTGAKNLQILHDMLLKSCMIRRRKVDVISQLPSVTYTVLPIEVNLREYRKAEADYMGWLAKKHPHMAASAAKAADLTRLNGLKQLAGQLKVKSVIDWTNDLLEETGGKLLLGCVHHSVGGPLMDAFGDRAVAVNGKLTAKQKQVAFDRFNLDPRARVLVGNLQAAGTGWSCISTSDAAICELPWVPSEVEQFSGRLHGIERGLPDAAAHIRFLVAEDTIESDLCQIIQTKRTWAAQAVDGETNSGGLDVYDQIKSLMRKRQTGGK